MKTTALVACLALLALPAPGDRKEVEVAYVCGAVAKTASAYEHRTLYLDCAY